MKKKCSEIFSKVKCCLPHACLFLFLILFSFCTSLSVAYFQLLPRKQRDFKSAPKDFKEEENNYYANYPNSNLTLAQELIAAETRKDDVSCHFEFQSWDWPCFLQAFDFVFKTLSTAGIPERSTPRENGGKIFVLCYSLVGIPLFWLTVFDLAYLLWIFLKFLHRNLCFCHKKTSLNPFRPNNFVLLAEILAFLLFFAGYVYLGMYFSTKPENIQKNTVAKIYEIFFAVLTSGSCCTFRFDSAEQVVSCNVYIFFGLVLLLIGIIIFSKVFWKLFYANHVVWISKTSNIWFKSRFLSIRELLSLFAEENTISQAKVDIFQRNLESVLLDKYLAAERVYKKMYAPLPCRTYLPTESTIETLEEPHLNLAATWKRYSGEYDNIPDSKCPLLHAQPSPSPQKLKTDPSEILEKPIIVNLWAKKETTILSNEMFSKTKNHGSSETLEGGSSTGYSVEDLEQYLDSEDIEKSGRSEELERKVARLIQNTN